MNNVNSDPYICELGVKYSDRFDYLFSTSALNALNNKFSVLVSPVMKTMFLTARAKSEEGLIQAATAIASEVNAISDMGFLLGCLFPLGTLALCDKFEIDGKFHSIAQKRDGVLWSVDGLTATTDIPENAVFVKGDTSIFCFIIVPWEFDYLKYPNLRQDLYCPEGSCGTVIFE